MCALVSERAALLASLCVAELAARGGRPRQTVAVDGSVFRHHPTVRPSMERYLASLLPTVQFTLTAAQDGSGRGAAFLAAIASQAKLQ